MPSYYDVYIVVEKYDINCEFDKKNDRLSVG